MANCCVADGLLQQTILRCAEVIVAMPINNVNKSSFFIGFNFMLINADVR